MEEETRDVAGWLAALANVPMTRERIAALALDQTSVLALAAVEYGEVEPACYFHPHRGLLP